MANCKKVVEMLDENLASFLELSKKLLIELKEKPEKKQVAVEPTEKFALLVDLGIITVPEDFIHGQCLENFSKSNRKKFYSFYDNITDQNFPNPSRVLKKGDKLRVKAFKQIIPGSTTTEERVDFLSTQKAVHTGAQGLSIVFEQKQDLLPKGYWYISFDEKEDHTGESRLWVDSDGDHWVPLLSVYSDGDFSFILGCFEFDWNDLHAFLCFCDCDE